MPRYQVKVDCSASWRAYFDVTADSAEEAEDSITREDYIRKIIEQMDTSDVDIDRTTAQEASEDGEEEGS